MIITENETTPRAADYRKRRLKAEARFWSMIPMTEGVESCWLWLGPVHWARSPKGMNGGYGNTSYHGKVMAPCKAMWLRMKGSFDENELEVCHTCDVRHCVNPKHLYLGTHSQNIVDCRKRGRLKMPHGIKLTEDDVREVVRLSREGATGVELAQRYGVTYPAIYAILAGRTWKDVTAGIEILRPSRDLWRAGGNTDRQREATRRTARVPHVCPHCGTTIMGNAIGYHKKACARLASAGNQ